MQIKKWILTQFGISNSCYGPDWNGMLRSFVVNDKCCCYAWSACNHSHNTSIGLNNQIIVIPVYINNHAEKQEEEKEKEENQINEDRNVSSVWKLSSCALITFGYPFISTN